MTLLLFLFPNYNYYKPIICQIYVFESGL